MRSVRTFLLAVCVAALGLAALFMAGKPGSPIQAQDAKALPAHLERVPLDADVFVHARVADIMGGLHVQEFRKALGKEAAVLEKKAEESIGLPLDIVETATFSFPRMPMGPGDEQTFMIVVSTTKPYDKANLLKAARKGEAKGEIVPLGDEMVLHLTGDKLFAVMHKSLLEQYTKAPAKGKDGPLADSIRLAATGKHSIVGGVNFDALPAEIRSSLPPEVQPFKPLIDSHSLSGFIDVGRDLTAEVRFQCKNADEAQSAERSWKLLMKLADEGLEFVLNDKEALKEIGPLAPALKELQSTVKGHSMKADGATLKLSATYKGDLPLAKMVKDMIEKAQKSAAQAQQFNNLKQIALAMHNYHDSFNGFPPAAICDKRGKPLLSWRVAILPFIEQDNLYKQFKLDEPWDSEHNKKLIKQMPKVYLLDGKQKEGDTKTHVRLFHGNGAVFDQLQVMRLQDIQDGTSNTLMCVEAADPVEWSKPDDLEYDPKADPRKLLLWDNDRVRVAFCDGSVRSISKKASDKVWHLLIQRNDGQPLPPIE